MNEARAYQALDISPKTHTYRQGYERYRYLAKKHHPDKGGETETFKVISTAWETVKSLLPKSFQPKPTSASSRLPLAKLVKIDENYYVRWFSVEFFGQQNYKTWVDYEKEGDTYNCAYKPEREWMPNDQLKIQNGITHNIKIFENEAHLYHDGSITVHYVEQT